MAVYTSDVWDLVTALLAKVRANATLTGTTYNVEIVDGPILSDVSRDNILFVGAQPYTEEKGPAQTASVKQNWGEIGARARYENLDVNCELWVRTGGTDLAVNRATAKALLTAIESDLRTDFTLTVGQLLWCHVTTVDMVQIQSTKGCSVVVPFTVAGYARLPSQ